MLTPAADNTPKTLEEIQRYAQKRLKEVVEAARKPKINIPAKLVLVRNGDKLGIKDPDAAARIIASGVEDFLRMHVKAVQGEFKKDFPNVEIGFRITGELRENRFRRP
jgi:biotin synthase-like enzyme